MDFIVEFLNKKIAYLASNYLFVLPLFVAFIWFLETVGFFGFFIPFEILSITYFALVFKYKFILIVSFFVIVAAVFLGLIVGYFVGRKYYSILLDKLEKKFPNLCEYLEKIDEYSNKYHFLFFLILINIWYTRPLMGLHLWGRKYNFKKYIIGSLFASFFYILPRFLIWVLIWIYGHKIVEKLKIDFKYILIGIGIFVLIYFIYDFVSGYKELKK